MKFRAGGSAVSDSDFGNLSISGLTPPWMLRERTEEKYPWLPKGHALTHTHTHTHTHARTHTRSQHTEPRPP